MRILMMSLTVLLLVACKPRISEEQKAQALPAFATV